MAMYRRDVIARVVKLLDNSTVIDMLDCEDLIADGLSRSGDTSGVRSGDVNRPTEAAALRLAGAEERTLEDGTVVPAEPDTWTERERDVVAEAIHEALAAMGEAAGALLIVERKLPVIVDAGAKLRERESSIQQCKACDRDVLGTRDDRLKAGYCEACYKAWSRAGMPDRFMFERDRPKRAGDRKIAGG
jgi:hypothetical protein